MDLFQNATDDQIALMGCFVALVASAALMYVSVYLNRSQRNVRDEDVVSRTLALKVHNDRSETENTTKRKVA